MLFVQVDLKNYKKIWNSSDFFHKVFLETGQFEYISLLMLTNLHHCLTYKFQDKKVFFMSNRIFHWNFKWLISEKKFANLLRNELLTQDGKTCHTDRKHLCPDNFPKKTLFYPRIQKHKEQHPVKMQDFDMLDIIENSLYTTPHTSEVHKKVFDDYPFLMTMMMHQFCLTMNCTNL